MAVKVNISATPKTNSEPEYIYHWDRIGFVLVAIIAICAGLWFGFSNWSEQHGSASLKTSSLATTTVEKAQPKAPTSNEPQIAKLEPLVAPEPKTVEPKAIAPEPNAKAPEPQVQAEPEAIASTTTSKTTTPPAITSEQPKAETIAPEPENTAPAPKTEKSEPKIEKTEPELAKTTYQKLDFIQKRTQILDESVTRFVTAAGVENREPVGSLKTLTHRRGGVARVYVFADVQNFKGETIQYHWYQNDNLLAKVDIEVKGNRWRNKTFQNIGPAMTGRWRVELMFGNIALAKTEFVVKRLED